MMKMLSLYPMSAKWKVPARRASSLNGVAERCRFDGCIEADLRNRWQELEKCRMGVLEAHLRRAAQFPAERCAEPETRQMCLPVA